MLSGRTGVLSRIVSTIPEGDSVLFLGRYNHDVRVLNGDGFAWTPDISDRSSIIVTHVGRPDLSMRFMTIHGSKGLQANHVFSLNNRSGPYGFPGSHEEPPIVSMILGGRDTWMDEERRLFYVAMTRANRSLYILTYDGHQSAFYRELFGDTASGTDGVGFCPVCRGHLVPREERYGRFHGCSNYHSRGCRFKRKVDGKGPS